MATWFRRPIIEALPHSVRSYLDDEDVAGRLFAPDVLDRRTDRARDRVLDGVAVRVEAPGRDIVDDRGRDRPKPNDRAVAGAHDLRHALRPGEGCVLGEMQVLPVRRHGDARPRPAVHGGELVPAWMARDMD